MDHDALLRLAVGLAGKAAAAINAVRAAASRGAQIDIPGHRCDRIAEA